MVKKLEKIHSAKVIRKAKKLTKIIPNVFKKIHQIFESNIFLQEVSIKEIGGHAQDYDKNTLKKMNEIFEKKSKFKKRKIKISVDEFKVIQETFKKHPAQSYLFSKNTIVSMVSTLDMLFVELFKFYYKKFPEKLSLDNQSISFKALKNITKIEDAQNFLITREIEAILINEGITKRLGRLNAEGKLNAIDEQLKDINKLVKIRNLIVHNGGSVDNEYVQMYGDDKINVGEKIKLSQKYLSDSLTLVYFVGTYILQDAQLNFSESREPREFLLNNLLHTLVKNDQHSFSRPIYNFALNNKIDNLNRKYIIINYCISLKKQGKSTEHIQKVLNLEDWSIKSEDFEMCKAVLLDKHDDFYEFLNESIKSKKVTKNEIDEWMIFCFYKDKPKFKSLVKKLK